MKLSEIEDADQLATKIQFERLENKFDRLENRLDARFNAIEAKFLAIDAKFLAIDARFNGIDGRFNAQRNLIIIAIITVAAQIVSAQEIQATLEDEYPPWSSTADG
jgi:hypothetical protein